MRIPSGVTDQYIYFVAVDATDLKTREPGLTTFTVYRSRNGAAAAAFTTPTVTEVDATNMPGVYMLLLDEDMSIGAGNDSEEMCFHITQASMAPVTRTIELYRPKITAGNTLGVAADGDVSGDVDGAVVGAVGSVTGAVGSVTAAILLPTMPANWITAAGITAAAMNGKGDWNVGKTGYALTVTPPTAAQINAEVVDVLKTDVITLPGQEAPPLTPTFEEALSWVYKGFRNAQDGSGSVVNLYADNGSTIDAKRTVAASAGLLSLGKWTSGP